MNTQLPTHDRQLHQSMSLQEMHLTRPDVSKDGHKTSQQPVFPSAYGYREGNAGMLGLLGFFMAVFPSSLLELISPEANQQAIWAYLLVFGGFLQIYAGAKDFHHGNSFSSCIFSIFGWHWVAKAILEGKLVSLQPTSPTGQEDMKQVIGIYLLTITIMNTVFMTLALKHPRGSVLLVITLLMVDIKLLFSTINVWVESRAFGQVGSFFGMIGALLALYSYIAESYAEEGILLPTGKYEDQTITRVTYDPKWKIRKQL
ncbi:GPR1/FUN34/yaaH family-domain-containing protein [Gorgonomyces haynaldii]|nr:GPR1/FUN34/yaaH family-domain-containing protein [Gorgonomyces haynaldii]